MINPYPHYEDCVPDGPWGSEQVEQLLNNNTQLLKKAGFLAVYLSEIVEPRRRALINSGDESVSPVVLKEDFNANGMGEFFLIGQVNTRTGILQTSSEVIVAYGNDSLEWQLCDLYKQLDIQVLHEALDSERELGLKVGDDLGSRAWS